MYQTTVDGQHYELGTSGFLYRSNKLMYDHGTKSMWSTLKGEPVVGSLVGKGIQLRRRHVVTTTWGAWKKRHPDTLVLSLKTGHNRNYNEGVAYHDYFETHELMFGVPKIDESLQNKDEVVALREGGEQLAISAAFLLENQVFHDEIGHQKFVILTDDSGANRVYESNEITFKSWDEENAAFDSEGKQWKVSPDSLTANGQSLQRLPSHRVFWFGWSAQFPDTRLVK